jgi:hypothetical protein
MKPFFAMLMARSTGDFTPLLACLRDPDVTLDMEARNFIADNWGKHRKGGDRAVEKYRTQLRIAAYVLEYSRGTPSQGKSVAAVDYAAKKYAAETGTVEDRANVYKALTFAKTVKYGQWRWWDIASRMARKGKIDKLHQTY